jgi:hypothetical protein
MKRALSLTLVTVAFASLAGAADILQSLNLPAKAAGEEVLNAFVYGHVNTSRVRDTFKPASAAVRATLVEGALVWTKAYTASSQFAKDYAAFRANAKPQLEQKPPVDEELKARRDQRAAEMAEAKKNIAAAPKEYRAAMEEGFKAAVEAQKQLDTPEFRKMERDSLVEERRADEERYREELAKWEQQWPADPKALVRMRLQEFLSATANVDFAAQTVNKNGKQRFVNAAYEQKPSEWKLAYRAGKEPTEKARAFASAWLKELK